MTAANPPRRRNHRNALITPASELLETRKLLTDLVASSVTVTPPEPGADTIVVTATMSFDVDQTSIRASSFEYVVELVNSSGQVVSTSGVLTTSGRGAQTRSVQLTAPDAPGQYTARLRLDPNNQYAESVRFFDQTFSRENNNTAVSAAFTIADTVMVTPGTGSIVATAIQRDGKIVMVGSMRGPDGNEDMYVTRLNRDGSLDTSFGDGGYARVAFDFDSDLNDSAAAVAIQRDGKIVLAGRASTGEDGTDFAVARLNANGSLDTGFGAGGMKLFDFFGGDDRATGVALQSDGKIVVVGTVASVIGDNDMGIVRLNRNGSLDTSFDRDGFQVVTFDRGGDLSDEAHAVAIQSNGRIVIAGSAEMNASGDHDFAVVRLTATGRLDTTFDRDGRQTVTFFSGRADTARAVAIAADGKIVLAGSAESNLDDNDFAIARLTSTGGLDTTFDRDGRQTVAWDDGGENDDQVTAVAVDRTGKITLAGISQSADGDYDMATTRLNANGRVDATIGLARTSANLGGSNNDRVGGMAIQSDGRIVMAGTADVDADGGQAIVAVRLNVNGRLDTTFGDGGGAILNFPAVDDAFSTSDWLV